MPELDGADVLLAPFVLLAPALVPADAATELDEDAWDEVPTEDPDEPTLLVRLEPDAEEDTRDDAAEADEATPDDVRDADVPAELPENDAPLELLSCWALETHAPSSHKFSGAQSAESLHRLRGKQATRTKHDTRAPTARRVIGTSMKPPRKLPPEGRTTRRQPARRPQPQVRQNTRPVPSLGTCERRKPAPLHPQ